MKYLCYFITHLPSYIAATVDTTKPIIVNCPASETHNTDFDKPTASVTWTKPTATDNMDVVDLTSNFPSGFEIEIGVTEVVYTATDPSNNQETCNFTVTVIGKLGVTHFTVVCP